MTMVYMWRIQRPARSTLTDTHLPCTTRFRSIIFQARIRARQRPQQPRAVGMIAVGTLVEILIAVPRPDRPDQEGEQHQQAENPRPHALAGHHARERKGLGFVDRKRVV